MSDTPTELHAERLRRQRVRTTLINLSRTGELPALPQTATAALALARKPDADTEELCDLIALDVGLAARILRIANSAAYIRRAPARTIRDAVLALGMRKTCDVLVAACFRQLHRDPGGYAQRLWHHALAVAIATEELARATRGIDPNLAFLPGLFHDVGRIAFLLADYTSVDVIQGLVEAGAGARSALEEEWYGFDHAVTGAVLAADWGLDPEQCEAIRCHHDPTRASRGRTLALLLSAADTIATAIGCGTGIVLDTRDAFVELGVSADDETGCTARVQALFAEQRELFA
jgi:putative nucleotidyltransferase with HDIG domain